MQRLIATSVDYRLLNIIIERFNIPLPATLNVIILDCFVDVVIVVVAVFAASAFAGLGSCSDRYMIEPSHDRRTASSN
ncbi:Hypothetical predicted protein [Octopus vulgaris]|uniref:Uncharacterized protein n=1 Tax=Octopus vulgaris TaxID=6645 RepID=A0AA36B8R2_OCTVU|nr:Hypothetical predicted protein [Octopus vulgaris]